MSENILAIGAQASTAFNTAISFSGVQNPKQPTPTKKKTPFSQPAVTVRPNGDKKPPRGPCYLVYLRVSTEEQALGLEAQRALCVSFVAGRLPLLEFIDQGVSGGAPPEERPALSALLGELQAGDVVVIANRSRLARDVYFALTIERLIELRKAKLVSADGVGNSDDPGAQLTKTIMDGFAAWERGQIRQRTKQALKVKRDRNEKTGGLVPYGQRLAKDGIHLEPNQEEQKTIQLVRSMFASGGLSLREISERLQWDGRLSRTGKAFSAMQIKRMVDQ